MKLNLNLNARAVQSAVLILVSVTLLSLFADHCQAQIRKGLRRGSSSEYRTANFVVSSPQPALSKQVGDLAEKFRKELAELWLGQALPNWPYPCPITVKIERHAGGQTSFAFQPGPDGRSQPFDWRMELYGSPERILDSVLPHEVTHTIFATHFGRPLPRWADEGACTTVEHVEERKKNHQMLLEFLTTNRGIPFNHMFAMKQYPRDILPLYAQGYSLARYLIQQRGHRHYVNFVGDGMQQEIPGREPQTWNRVVKKHYGYEDLSDLQLKWQAWVRNGSPDLQRVEVAAAAGTAPPAPTPTNPVAKTANATWVATPTQTLPTTASSAKGVIEIKPGESWYARQSRTGGSATMQRPENPPELPLQREQDVPDHYRPGSLRSATAPPPEAKTLWR